MPSESRRLNYYGLISFTRGRQWDRERRDRMNETYATCDTHAHGMSSISTHMVLIPAVCHDLRLEPLAQHEPSTGRNHVARQLESEHHKASRCPDRKSLQTEPIETENEQLRDGMHELSAALLILCTLPGWESMLARGVRRLDWYQNCFHRSTSWHVWSPKDSPHDHAVGHTDRLLIKKEKHHI